MFIIILAVPYGIMRNTLNDAPGYILMARVGIHLAEAISRHFDPVGITISTKLSETFHEDYSIFNDTDTYSMNKTRLINNQKKNFAVRIFLL